MQHSHSIASLQRDSHSIALHRGFAKRLCCESTAHADSTEPTQMGTTDPKGCTNMSAANPPEPTQTSAPGSQMAHLCNKIHCVAMPETPTNAGNRYAFVVAYYSKFSVSRLSTLWHCGSDPVNIAVVWYPSLIAKYSDFTHKST